MKSRYKIIPNANRDLVLVAPDFDPVHNEIVVGVTAYPIIAWSVCVQGEDAHNAPAPLSVLDSFVMAAAGALVMDLRTGDMFDAEMCMRVAGGGLNNAPRYFQEQVGICQSRESAALTAEMLGEAVN